MAVGRWPLSLSNFGKHLFPVGATRDLGVILDTRTFNDHVTATVASCMSRLSHINRVKHCFDNRSLILIINALVFNKLYYWLGLCDMYNVFYRLLSNERLTLESWFTNLGQTPLNRSQQLPAPYKPGRTNYLLTRSSKTNYERTIGELTIWLTIDDCLTVTIDGSKRTNYWLRVFIANNITA